MMAPTLLLILAGYFDLRSARFPNWLFVVSLLIGLALTMADGGWLLAIQHFAWALGFFILLIPLVLLKTFGAGDAKLMMNLALFTSFSTTLNIFLYSLFWGLLIGLLRMALTGQLVTFTTSYLLRTPQVTVQKIPYTFAILLGWLSVLSVGGLV
jgi:Flp pilus assembly protein protease CpaA